MISQINPEARIICDEERLRPSGSEVERLFGDNTKLKSTTGWQPRVTIDEGIERTIEWFRDSANLARYKSDIYNV